MNKRNEVMFLLHSSIEENKEIIKQSYKNSPDITYRTITVSKEDILLVFNQSLTSAASINDFILKNLSDIAQKMRKITPKKIIDYFNNVIPGNNLKEITNFDEVYNFLGINYFFLNIF